MYSGLLEFRTRKKSKDTWQLTARI